MSLDQFLDYWMILQNYRNVIEMPSLALSNSITMTSAIDASWYASASSPVNNLTTVLNDSGTWGFIFNSSKTADEKYGIYNWCNMPHVRRTEYPKASVEYELEFVEVIHRHHKRTPYSSNAFPTEPYHWDCPDVALFYTGEPHLPSDLSAPQTAKAYLSLVHTQQNQWTLSPIGWQGTCQFPQLTAEGLEDSFVHGQDLYGVYHDLLGFLPGKNKKDWLDMVQYRVTNNKITSQVAGMVVAGMWGVTPGQQIPLFIEPDGIDSLEPQMSCPIGSNLFNDIMSSGNFRWANHLIQAAGTYATLDDISGVSPTDPGFHTSFNNYYDNLSARQCHDKPLPCKIDNSTNLSTCITQNLADTVYRLGQWEYAEIYRSSSASLNASATTFGTWVATVADHIRDVSGRGAAGAAGGKKYWHNIAHDGSLARLLSVLQVEEMIWPGMGSEVVFEVYRKGVEYFVRVLFGGKVFVSANPTLATMDMVPVERVLGYLDGLTGVSGADVYGKCTGSIAL